MTGLPFAFWEVTVWTSELKDAPDTSTGLYCSEACVICIHLTNSSTINLQLPFLSVLDNSEIADFEELNEPFEVDEIQEPIEFSYDTLAKLYSEARLVEENRLTKEELAKFRIITDFTYETFDLAFGNRILNQIHQFVPVYVACGGTKVEALDFLFTRKILYKIEGRFEDYIKNGLLDLKDLVIKEFGNEFEMTIKEINRLLKRL